MLKDIDPNMFAKSFTIRVRDTAKTLAAISGLIDSVRATKDPSNVETIALRIANYARGEIAHQRKIEEAICMLARLSYNSLVDLEADPDFDSILRENEPRTDTDTIIIGAYARHLLDTDRPVRIAWLAVLANMSYANCAMSMHRGKLDGERGMVTVTSARAFLTERQRPKSPRAATVPHKLRNEVIPRKRKAS